MNIYSETSSVGLIMVLLFVLVFALLVGGSRIAGPLKVLLIGAIIMRVVGSVARYWMVFDLYRGAGDSVTYFNVGMQYAEYFARLDFSPFWDHTLWVRSKQWWGTQFVTFPAGFVLAATGRTVLGSYIVFSFIAFVGLYGFVKAYVNSFPHVPITRYARWVWLFPALWFWPSAIGKESLMLLGLGTATMGFVGKRGRANWFWLVLGLLLIFAVRPQVAAVFIVSMVMAQWLSIQKQSGGWTPFRMFQAIIIVAIGIVAMRASLSVAGVDALDTEDVAGYLNQSINQTTKKGTTIGTIGDGLAPAGAPSGVGLSLKSIPLGMVNVFFRPFFFEAGSFQVMISALEMTLLWLIVWYRRKNVAFVLNHWNSGRFLRLCVPFVLMYAALLGMAVGNLGIMARQRIFIFPFIFLIIEAAPLVATEPVPQVRESVPSRYPVG